MIATPLNYRKSYCIDDYFKNVLSLSYPNRIIYAVDNSPNPTFAMEQMRKHGVEIDWFNPNGMRNQDYIRHSMNNIRHKFLQSDCDYLFILECDLFPKGDIIERLMGWQKQVVSAPYFLGEGVGSFLSDTEIEDSFGHQNDNRHLGWYGGFLRFKKMFQPAQQCGLGCTLLRRDVVEQTEFHTVAGHPAHHDTWFYFLLHDIGIKVWWDTREIIEHRNKSWNLINDAQPC